MIVVQVTVSHNGQLVARGEAEGPGPDTVDLLIAATTRAQEQLIERNLTHALESGPASPLLREVQERSQDVQALSRRPDQDRLEEGGEED